MTLISGFCFFLAFAGILSMLAPRTDVLAPARLFLIVWSLSIGLADLKLSLLQAQWSTYAWLLLLLGIGAMFTGMFMSHVVFMDRPKLSIGEIRAWFTRVPLNERVLFRMTLILFVLYFVSYCLEVAFFGNAPMFSARPDVARVKFGVFGIHLLVMSMPVLLYLVVQYFLLAHGSRFRKSIMVLVFVVTSVTFLTLLQRFLFVMAALFVLGLAYYGSRRIRPRHLLVVGSVFMAALLYVQSLRLSKYVGNFFEVISRMKYGKSPGLFIEPYMYISMNLENFARAVDKLDSFTFGYFTADPIMALSGLKHWLANDYGIIERPFLNSGYNTYAFLWTYYRDFGPLGVAIIPLLLGVAIGAIHAWLRIRPGLVTLSLYAASLFIVVISFIANPFSMLGTTYGIVLLVVLQWYLSVRSA